MNQSDVFSVILKRNQESIGRAIAGLSHKESVLQLPGESNCMNWTIGHICVYRDGMLACLGQDEQMTESEVNMYRYGSQPIKEDADATNFVRLIELQEAAFHVLIEWLGSAGDVRFLPDIQNNAIKKGYCGYFDTVSEHFAQMLGHEAIHVGELNALRELALVQREEGRR